MLWKLFNNYRFLFAQHLGSHARALCAYFPDQHAQALSLWPNSVPHTVAPTLAPAPSDIRCGRNPRPVQPATGGRLNSFTRFSGEGVGRELKGGGREGRLLGADLRIRSDVIASEKLNSPVLWGAQINIFSGRAQRPLIVAASECL